MPIILLIALLATSTTAAPHLTRHEFASPHMGTLFRIVLYAPDKATAERAASAAFALAEKLNDCFSDYQADSELMRLVAQGEAVVSPELFEILAIAQCIAAETCGAFDITAAPHTRNWRKARITRQLPTPEEIARARAASGWQKLKLDPATRTVTLTVPGMFLDLGGIAKGYTADAMLKLLKEKHHLPIASVAAGGDIAVGDPPPGKEGWQVAIAPDGKEITRTLTLANQAVSTSGKTAQKITIGGKTYSHIIDPKTGLGLTGSTAVSVIAAEATRSDALATALSVMGKKRAQAFAKKAKLQALWPNNQ